MEIREQIKKELMQELELEYVLVPKSDKEPINTMQDDDLLNLITKLVALSKGVKPEDILNGGGVRPLPDCRKLIAFLIKSYRPQISYHKLGKYLKRDHSAVVAAKIEAKKNLELVNNKSVNPDFRLAYDRVLKKIDTYNKFGIIN